MTAQKPAKADIRMILKVSRERGYSIVTMAAQVVTLDADGKVRNPLWDGEWSAKTSPADAYDSLIVAAQHNTDDDEGPRWYGWEARYHYPYAVDLDRATAMVRTLKRINVRLTAIAAKYGSPDTLAAYIARVADALGATAPSPFGVRVDRDRDYNGTGFRWMDADGLASYLAGELAAGKPAAAA